ncbi:hypothetical protein PAE9249_03633 [Paenibacillus sp. CECT 9249]|uniref:nuclear transport factor 2 family protein n=1 Tax=Paenibacillus sp. CECT 9249 TaxID=2845385 RepID=UPI001E29AA48|nr:nuclear transport factor 2 family protein [Paenibacillus sp. CECT 9249]CAH0121107.1 hypothetical protein PAE9249_03633 [Paenibacillus sp. CECT 9249]
MNRDQATQIIRQYFESWVKKDMEMFRSVLHDKAIVRECNGTVIEGRDELTNWFTQWNGNDNKVEYWTIKSVGFDEIVNTAFVEWIFKCVYDAQEYEWEGSSIVYFRNSLLYELNEYEMKREKFYPYRKTI